MELVEFVESLQQWHERQVHPLKQIVDKKDAVIQIDGIEIEPESDMAKGLRFGVGLSLEFLGKLPFSVSIDDEE